MEMLEDYQQAWSLQYIPENSDTGLAVSSAGHFHTKGPGMNVYDRIRDDYLILACTGGKGYFRNVEEQHEITENMLFICLPGISHSYWPCDKTGWDIWWTHFSGSMAGKLLETGGFSPERMVAENISRCGVIKKLKQLNNVLQEAGIHAYYESSSLLFGIIMEMAKLPRPQVRHERIAASLKSSYESVEEMAKAASMSKYHFIREFRKAVGITPWRYILTRKIGRAKEMLISSDMAVKQIALKSGFEDANYFSYVFKREAGCTPSEFRKNSIR